MPFLEIRDLHKQLDGQAILSGIKLTALNFQKIAVVGETGSGKSTLLKIIAGLVQADGGSVTLEGRPVLGPENRLVRGEPGICYLSQNYELQRFLTVQQVLQYANSLTPEAASRIYHICQIDHLLAHSTDNLSGGEKQRIALAKALITSPHLLLLDEPYSNLDGIHKKTLKKVVGDICDQLNITCMLVSHDPVDVLSWADEIVILKEGRIVRQGPPPDVYRNPQSAYVAGLLGTYSLLTPALRKIFASKDAFVRPEQFTVRPDSKKRKGVKGTVRATTFCGSYAELIVQIGRARIVAYTDPGTRFETGDAVDITIRK